MFWKSGIDQPQPPVPGEIVVSQTKMGLNFLDVYQTSGVYPFPENDVFVPGNEAAGRVIAVGEGSQTCLKEIVGYPMHVGALLKNGRSQQTGLSNCLTISVMIWQLPHC